MAVPITEKGCSSPRLFRRGLCRCVNPKKCPYSESGRKRILAEAGR